jgi:hypothetical protein
MAPRATSLPVPAVVGTAITGAVALLIDRLSPSMVGKALSGPE